MVPTDAEEENELKSLSETAGEEGSETSKSESENGEEALAEGSEVTYDLIFHSVFKNYLFARLLYLSVTANATSITLE